MNRISANLAPTPERWQHGNIARSPVIADSTGAVGHPWHCRSLLDNLLARREIASQEHAAGLQFSELARRAAVPTLQASNLMRVRSGGRLRDGSGSERARHQLGLALDALGGLGSPMGSLVWDVLGRDESLSAWAQRQTWIGGRGGAAKGVLMAALPVLARHFGLTRQVPTR